MTSKAKELDNLKDGDRTQCPICSPRRGVPADRLWAWSLANPRKRPLKDSPGAMLTSRPEVPVGPAAPGGKGAHG